MADTEEWIFRPMLTCSACGRVFSGGELLAGDRPRILIVEQPGGDGSVYFAREMDIAEVSWTCGLLRGRAYRVLDYCSGVACGERNALEKTRDPAAGWIRRAIAVTSRRESA